MDANKDTDYTFESDARARRYAEGERRAKQARFSLILTIVLTTISIIGASTFWILLPARIQEVTEKNADHEIRLRALETLSGEHAATLGRIDERTKSIQESVADIRQRIQSR